MPAIIPILIAAAAAGAILLIALGLAGSSPVDPVQARLTQLGTMQAKNLEELELQPPFLERTLRPLAAPPVRPDVARREQLVPGTDREATRPRRQPRQPARRRLARHQGRLRGRRRASCSCCCSASSASSDCRRSCASSWASIGLMFGYTIPEFWLGGRVKKRQHAILLQIPDTLDLLTISVRAGLGFDAALGKVVEKMEGPLVDEFRRALAEVRVGKARREALRDIVPRTEVPPLTNFIGAIIQAEQLGVSISKVLQVQSEQLRIERRQRAEEQAAKAPIKMLFPLVGCIFPSLFIVILGPAIILIMQNLRASRQWRSRPDAAASRHAASPRPRRRRVAAARAT